MAATKIRAQGAVATPGRSPAAVNTSAAAEYLSTTKQTLDTWRYRGEGPPFVKMGRRVVYRLEALDRWLAENEVATV